MTHSRLCFNMRSPCGHRITLFVHFTHFALSGYKCSIFRSFSDNGPVMAPFKCRIFLGLGWVIFNAYIQKTSAGLNRMGIALNRL